MSHLKLMKLMYLADREAVRAFGLPISRDRFVSMPHGPVLSMTLNLMDGDVESLPGGWTDWISAKEDNELSLNKFFEPDDLTELNRAELAVLKAVWAQFGAMEKWEIRDWTHVHCPEWKDPKGSSYPITFQSLARAVGLSETAANELAAQIEADQEIDSLFATL